MEQDAQLAGFLIHAEMSTTITARCHCLNMNNFPAPNDIIDRSGCCKPFQEVPMCYDGQGVWIQQPSLRAFFPPTHNQHTPVVSNQSHHRIAYDKDSNIINLTKANHNRVGIPKTIAIPVSPGTLKTDTDNEFTDADDDCSSVGMGSVGKESPQLKSRHEHLDDDSSLESIMEGPQNNKRKRMMRLETLHNDEYSSVAPIPKELKWDGSLSYLDDLREHESLLQNSTRQTTTTDSMNGGMSIGTFDISGFVDPNDQYYRIDDDASMESDDNDRETVIVAAGSSIPQPAAFYNEQPAADGVGPEIIWDGSCTFLDCFDKNASLDDFLDAERNVVTVPMENMVVSALFPANFARLPIAGKTIESRSNPRTAPK